MRHLIALLVITALFGLATVLGKAGGHSHAAPNGGQIQRIGAYEGELVVRGPEVMLYVVDEKEQKVDASKLSATALVLAKGNEQKSDSTQAGQGQYPGWHG
jgi:hypothetical protein